MREIDGKVMFFEKSHVAGEYSMMQTITKCMRDSEWEMSIRATGGASIRILERRNMRARSVTESAGEEGRSTTGTRRRCLTESGWMTIVCSPPWCSQLQASSFTTTSKSSPSAPIAATSLT